MMSRLRPSLIRWTADGLYYSRLIRPFSIAAGYAGRSVFQILSYHRVNDDDDPFFPALPTRIFERHIAYIARTCCVLTVEALAERARHGHVPRNAVAITFDDGYRDNLTHAAPILARHGLPATIFLATGFIDTAEVAWFDRVAMGFKHTRLATVRTPWGETLAVGTDSERLHARKQALAYLKRRPDDELRRMVEGLLDALGVTHPPGFENLMLSWSDVQVLVGLGFSIGAHTVSHPVLSRISAQRAWTEIVESRSMIKAACGVAPKAFAYPNGGLDDYTETVKELVRQAGFACAVTTRFGLNGPDTSPYELRRGGPWEWDLPTFALKLASFRLIGV